jgi:hypothetical protein
MTKAKNDLPQEKGPAAQEPEKKGETAPNGAEKNSANDADGSPNADAQTDAPASDDGKAGGDVGPNPIRWLLADTPPILPAPDIAQQLTDLIEQARADIDAIGASVLQQVRDQLPKMLAEVEAERLANADQAEKDRRDAELAEQRKQEQAARTRQRREERDRAKAEQDRVEARAVELEAATEFYAHIAGSDVPHAQIVERCKTAPNLLVMFADGQRFNIDIKTMARQSGLKSDGGMLFLKDRIDIAVDVPASTITECWLIPVNDPGQSADCGLRCQLGSGVAIGGGRPVMFPAEFIAWRC